LDPARLVRPGGLDPGQGAWRALDKVSGGTCRSWRAGPSPGPGCCLAAWCGTDLSTELVLDFDATVVIAHSDNRRGPNLEAHLCFHPLYCFLDRPDVSSAKPGRVLRPGNAGSNTAADHIAVLDMAAAEPAPEARPGAEDTSSCWPGRILPGATHEFCCRLPGQRASVQPASR